MAQAKHILVARTQGPEAGMEAYLQAPSSKIHDSYKEITRKRTKASRLATYCRIFADQIGPAQSPVQADRAIGDVQALAERLAALIKGEDESESEPEYSDQVMALATALNVDPSLIAQVLGEEAQDTETADENLVTNSTFITSDVAWAVLGRGVNRPQEARRSIPATNAQLWRMNQEGLFPAECVQALNEQALGA